MKTNQRAEVDARTRREQQGRALQEKEAELRRLAAEHNREEFFKQIVPLLKPLESYINRRLRIANIELQIRTPMVTSGDVLDEVVLAAYENYARKPSDLTLEEWLYQLSNQQLQRYISQRRSAERQRRSLEGATQAELRSLEEIPFTADADGEAWFPEELDDSEYQLGDFTPPAETLDPEKQLQRKEELTSILRALCHIPEQERNVFELFVVEGFTKEAVARILGIPPDSVPKIAEKVRAQVLQEIMAESDQGRQGRERPSKSA